MGTIILRTASGHVIYKSNRTHHRAAVEDAVMDGVSLHHADLSGLDLSHGDFDGGNFRHVNFDGSNMTGTNLSECRMTGASFKNVALHGACMAQSHLIDCDFSGVLFGGTDIFGTVIRGCRFDTQSALELHFHDCDIFEKNMFVDVSGLPCPINRPPVTILGGPSIMAITTTHVIMGNKAMTIAEWMRANTMIEKSPSHGLALAHLRLMRGADTQPPATDVAPPGIGAAPSMMGTNNFP